MIDLEVGRYALRTFHVYSGKLESVTIGQNYWIDGTCAAKCLPYGVRPGRKTTIFHRKQHISGDTLKDVIEEEIVDSERTDHTAPELNCSCGIYGSLSMRDLMTQYHYFTDHIVAVIAAEGTTIIGSRGLRTQFARVVACWVRDDLEIALPEAQRFSTREEMLEKYHLPWKSTDPMSEYDAVWRKGETVR